MNSYSFLLHEDYRISALFGSGISIDLFENFKLSSTAFCGQALTNIYQEQKSKPIAAGIKLELVYIFKPD